MAKRIYANERKNNIFEKKVMPENNIYYATLKTRHGYRWLRRFQDILFSLIAIIILSPVMLITVISIIIDDPKGGPVFSQIRVGKNGKEFKMYKFRSMVVDAEDRLKELLEENEMDGPVFKIADDPRITRVGKFIRKTSIDELPQLFNILKGDMRSWDLVLLCPERLSNILLIKPSDCLLHRVLRVTGKFSQTEMTFLLMNGSRWIYSISVNAVFLWIGKSYLKQLS